MKLSARIVGIYTPNTFSTSSPKWSITLTAMRPVAGRGNGRDVPE